MIIIRTNASSSSGIGHLARCRRLAVSLKDQGLNVCFALDSVNDYLSGFLKGFTCQGIYSLNKSFISEIDDAIRFSKCFNNQKFFNFK